MSLAEFRKAVIQERALELAFEGNRLYDLRRTASVTATVPEAPNSPKSRRPSTRSRSANSI